MANINVTFTENTITVDETTSNVAVTETVSNIIVSSSAVASNADIRAAISNTSPITYNSTTGVIGIDSGAVFSGKTTDDLAEGTTNLYFTNARVGAYLTSNFTTTDIPEGANLYYTVARANAAFNNILTSNVVTFENGAVFNEGFRTPLYNAGSYSSGSVILTTENSTAQEITLTGNVGYVSWSDWQDGQVLHLVVKQDAIGGHIIDFTDPNYAANGWDFYNGIKTIDTAPNAETLITIQNFSSKRYATINTGDSTTLTNAQVVSYISTQPLTVGGNLTVTGDATISGNDITVANVFATRISTTTANLFLGGTDIDIPTSVSQPITFNKNIYVTTIADFGGQITAAGGLRTTSSANIETTTGNITTGGHIVGAYLHGDGSNITGILTNAQVVSYIATQPLTVGGNLTVNGNINATGNINYQNVTDLYVTDQKITLNSNAATNANVEVIAYRPEATDTKLKWNEQSDIWEFTNDGTTYYPIPTSTTDLAEGTNLYYTTDRANTAIADKLIDSSQKKIFNAAIQDLYITPDAANATGGYYMPNGPSSVGDVLQLTGSNQALWQRLDTGDVDEGANLYYTTARANSAIDDYVVGSENITVTSGAIALTNALGNVNSVTAEASTNLTLNTNDKLVLTQVFDGATVNTANIRGDGYAFFKSSTYSQDAFGYSGSADIVNYVMLTGNATSGSNAITDVDVYNYYVDTQLSLSDLPANSFISLNEQSTYPFPPGTRVTSVDAANSTVYMSANATATVDLALGSDAWIFHPALHDSETGLTVILISDYDLGGASKTTVLADNPFVNSAYGYPITGPVPSNFDIITAGSSSDYTVTQANIEDNMIGRTKLTAPRTVLQAPRGLIVGENADLTNRAENDPFPSFGVNVLWDGTSDPATEYAGVTPLTQILVKSYTDNNLQGGDEIQRSRFGPRLFFTASEGNALEPFSVTYPRENLELGRIAWWGPSSTNPALGTSAPSGWISGVTSQDYTVRNSGLGMYFGVKHNVNNNNASIWAGQKNGQTLLAGGYTGNSTANITLAPLDSSINNGNSVAMFDAGITNKLFANVGYANMSSQTGSRITLTNGPEVTNPGDIIIEIDRNVTPPGVANVAVDAGYGIYDASLGGGTSDYAVVSIYYSGQTNIAPNTTAITFNNVTGPGAANINGQTFYINNSQDLYGAGDTPYLFTDSALTTPALMSTLGAVTGSTGGGYLEYTLTVDSVSKNWSFELEEASEDLKLKADGNTAVTFTDAGNISATTFIGNVSGTTATLTGNVDASTVNANLNGTTATLSGNADITGNINLGTNAAINYDAVYGCFHNLSNITAANADTVYAFEWPNVHINTNRVTVASNTQITLGQEGTYQFDLEMQAENTANADKDAYIWLAKNGTDIAESGIYVNLLKLWKQRIVKVWIVENLNAGDYIEVRFAVSDPTDIQLTSIPSQASPYARPAIPSAVLTVKPVGA